LGGLVVHIYIDESGIFRNPANRDNIMSCVSALVIPGSQREAIFEQFRDLLSTFPPPSNSREIKGSELNEAQIAQVVELLLEYEVVLDTICIDLGLHTEDEITNFRTRQADNVIAFLTPEHQPTLIAEAHEQREYILRMPNQHFVQAFLTWSLIPRLFQKVTLYYAVRIPSELGEFNWVVDAKDIKVTDFERSWSTVIHPIVYAHSLREPLVMVEGGDYSFFEKFRDDDEERMAAIREEENLDEEIDALSMAKIFNESLTFDPLFGNLGIQLADILVNATQRAMNGKLQRLGWADIGALMVGQSSAPIRVISFNTTDDSPRQGTFRSPAFSFIEETKRKSKSILP
jgi:hypothetical protein